MKKTGEIKVFDGRHGIIEGELENFEFHISDITSPLPVEQVQLEDIVEFRAEYRELNVKRAKNIKILQKSKDKQ